MLTIVTVVRITFKMYSRYFVSLTVVTIKLNKSMKSKDVEAKAA